MLSFIERQVKQTNAKRLCIDSITALAYSINEKNKIRQFIFEIGKLLSALGCTTILTSEVAEKERYSVYGVEEFIADAIINLERYTDAGVTQRRLQVVKVRGKECSLDYLSYKLTKNGILAFPLTKNVLHYSATGEKISTGNDVLDNMFYGGVFKGSVTIVNGQTGAGKSLVCLQFLLDGLKKNEQCLYVSFEESKEQLYRNMKELHWDLKLYEEQGVLTVLCQYPKEKFLDEHLQDIRNIIQEKNISRCAIDSLTALSHYYPQENTMNFITTLTNTLKSHNTTSFFTLTSGTDVHNSMHLGIAMLTDNIIILKYAEHKSIVRFIISIMKARGSEHSKALRHYDISDQGIIISYTLMSDEYADEKALLPEKNVIAIEAQLRKYIGPITSTVMMELKREGLSRQCILAYLEEIGDEHIIHPKELSQLKSAIITILNTEPTGDTLPRITE